MLRYGWISMSRKTKVKIFQSEFQFTTFRNPLPNEGETALAAHIHSRHPSFLLFDHPNNLGFAKSALSHLFVPSKS
jgi:hypothetical protein